MPLPSLLLSLLKIGCQKVILVRREAQTAVAMATMLAAEVLLPSLLK